MSGALGPGRAGPESCDLHPGPSASLTSGGPWLLREEVARPLSGQKEALMLEKGMRKEGLGFQESAPPLTPWQPGSAGGAACGAGSLGAAWMGVSWPQG